MTDAGFSFLASAAAVITAAAALAFEPPPPIDLNDFAEQNIIFKNDSPFPGPYDRDRFPFNERILECLGPDHPSRTVTLIKSAQTGGTIMGGIFIGGCLVLDPGPSSYVHPTVENGKTWVNTKWKPMVRNCAALKAKINIDGSRDSKSSTTYQERYDGRGHLLIRGANSAAGLSQWSSSRQVQDDLSKWDLNEAGDPESQATSRLSAFPWAKIFKISTPMIDGSCRITRAFKNSTQEHWHVPCPHCGHKHPLEWENFISHIDEDHPEKSHFSCPKCGGVIEHRHKKRMVAKGEWVAHNRAARQPGFYIWDAYTNLTSWSLIAEEWITAKGIAEKEQTFMNDVVGRAYKQAGDAPEWEWLQKRAEATGHMLGTIPLGGLLLVAAVDCQGDRVEVHVMAFGEDRQRWTVDYEVVPGHISEQCCRDRLDEILKKDTWPDQFGNERHLDHMAIDSGAYTVHAYDWARAHPDSKVMVVKGVGSDHAVPVDSGKIIKYTISGRKFTLRRKLWKVGVSQVKGGLYKDLRKEDPDERGFHGFPRGLSEDFYQQYCAERKTPRRTRTGFVTMEWTKPPGQANEVLDTAVYAEAAARRIGWDRLTPVQWERKRLKLEVPPDPDQGDLLDPDQSRSVKRGALTAAEKADAEKATGKKSEKKKSIVSKLAGVRHD